MYVIIALDIIGYIVKARTQEEVNQVIDSWRKGELKTLEEENGWMMEKLGLVEAKHTMSPAMEEEKHEEIMDEDEYEGNDEEETLLNEEEER